MKYEIEQSVRFKRELKAAIKRGYDINKLEAVVDLLAQGLMLPASNRDHVLSGDYIGYRECHMVTHLSVRARHSGTLLA
jgi:mRNA interferase YafQ